jgi:hypothetical protein
MNILVEMNYYEEIPSSNIIEITSWNKSNIFQIWERLMDLRKQQLYNIIFPRPPEIIPSPSKIVINFGVNYGYLNEWLITQKSIYIKLFYFLKICIIFNFYEEKGLILNSAFVFNEGRVEIKPENPFSALIFDHGSNFKIKTKTLKKALNNNDISPEENNKKMCKGDLVNVWIAGQWLCCILTGSFDYEKVKSTIPKLLDEYLLSKMICPVKNRIKFKEIIEIIETNKFLEKFH